jgi:hypothetical protein
MRPTVLDRRPKGLRPKKAAADGRRDGEEQTWLLIKPGRLIAPATSPAPQPLIRFGLGQAGLQPTSITVLPTRMPFLARDRPWPDALVALNGAQERWGSLGY